MVAFASTRGETALRLALHAAVPQVLRPELLHLLRLNFVPEASADPAVEADVLFATFCEDLGNGYFRFEPSVRSELLEQLDPSYEGDRRLRSQQVATFLLAYFDRRSVELDNDPLYRSYSEIERWVAMAFLDPSLAAEQLATALRLAVGDGAAARLQIGGLASVLSTPLVHYQKLLAYAAGVEALQAGNSERARQFLNVVGDAELQVGTVTLPAPRGVLRAAFVAEPQAEPQLVDGASGVSDAEPASVPTQGTQPEGHSPPRLYVAYAYQDRHWYDELRRVLEPAIRAGKIEVGAASDLATALKLREALEPDLEQYGAALVLVSIDYLASAYHLDVELPILLQRHKAGQLRLTWLLVRACLVESSGLFNILAISDPRRPLDTLTRAERENALADVAKGVVSWLEPAPKRPDALEAEAAPGRNGRRAYVSALAPDVAQYFETILRVVSEANYHCVRMDPDASGLGPESEGVVEPIASCDVVICVVGWRHDPRMELEYARAVELQLPVLTFLAVGSEPLQHSPVRSFRERLTRERLVSYFRTEHELGSRLAASLARSGTPAVVDGSTLVFISCIESDLPEALQIGDEIRRLAGAVEIRIVSDLQTVEDRESLIDRSVAFVAVLSRASAATRESWFNRDCHWALECSKKLAASVAFIFPVIVDGLDPSDTLFTLREFAHIQAPEGVLSDDGKYRISRALRDERRRRS